MTNTHTIKSWLALTAILLAALALRWVFFTGYFGSDEVTYTNQALFVSQGVWKASDYIGSVRLGVNLPVGLFMRLFGRTEFVANLWSLLCSLGEIALVFLIARRFWGLPAAVAGALLLAFAPLHAHLAGRLMADAPLAFFITLSFYALFRGDLDQSRRWHLAAGLAAGGVWWVKSHVALVYVPVFAILALRDAIREKRLNPKWLVMGAGFAGMVVLNSLVFWAMQGDFWHLVRLTVSGASEYVRQAGLRTEPGYYLHYLFVDVRHTWFLGPLALLGLVLWATRGRSDDGLTRVAIWGIGLVGIFSLFFVSLSPPAFITKQVNYMTIFLAPLTLLGGYALSRLPRTALSLALAAVVMAGVLGTAFEQQVIRSFVANSKSAQSYVANIPGRPVYGMTSALRYGYYLNLFAADPDGAPPIRDLARIDHDRIDLARNGPDRRGFVAYAVIDMQTADWGGHARYTALASLPECWRRIARLEPVDQGAGAAVTAALIRLASVVPGGQAARAKLDELIHPQPAFVYGISAACMAGKAINL
ncbi:MAG: glycosyltransferase family 39 protein [Sulfuricella sp.]|nr:glycosyltransferase family 39 protein [Sulfuricella sp.]